MTKPELKTLYVEAAARARVAPNLSEEAVWFSKLGALDIADLKAAIDAHFDKSHWMPKESELRPLAENAKRGRMIQANASTTYARWRCPVHPAVVVGAFIEPTDFRKRRCPKSINDKRRNPDGAVICAAKMDEIWREDNFSSGNKTVREEEPERVA